MTELERLQGLWCRGVATVDQINECRALERRLHQLEMLKRWCWVGPLFCLVFSLLGALGGFIAGVLILDLEGAELSALVMAHFVMFAKGSGLPLFALLLMSLW